MSRPTTRGRRRTTLASSSVLALVVAVFLGSAGLAVPASAVDLPTLPALPGAPAAPDTPLAATLRATTPTVATGGTVRLAGTSPALGALLAPLEPVPVLPVSIQRKVAGQADFAEIATVVPSGDGSFGFAVKQARTAQYRAVPLAPVGSAVQPLLDQLGVRLVASDTVSVSSRGSVSLASKRVARRTYALRGVAAPVVKGQLVSVQVKRGKAFRTVKQVRTTASGAWSTTVKLPRGKRSVRVVAAATSSATAATAARVVRSR